MRRALLAADRGATVVEYVLLVSAIAGVVLILFGGVLVGPLTGASQCLTEAIAGRDGQCVEPLPDTGGEDPGPGGGGGGDPGPQVSPTVTVSPTPTPTPTPSPSPSPSASPTLSP